LTQETIHIDEKDKEILNILQENYKISYKELGDRVGLAASSTHARVKNLIKNGVIREFDTIVCPQRVGFSSVAILGLSVDPIKMEEIANQLASYHETQLVATSTGDHDLIIQVYAKDDKDLWRFINQKIKTIKGVKSRMDVSNFIDIYKMTYKIHFDGEEE